MWSICKRSSCAYCESISLIFQFYEMKRTLGNIISENLIGQTQCKVQKYDHKIAVYKYDSLTAKLVYKIMVPLSKQ